MISINSYDNLIKLVNKEIGETALVEDTHEVYTYTETGWEKINDINTDEENSQKLTLYGINKLIIPQIPSLTDEQIGTKKRDILDKFIDKTNGNYYLLLSRNIGYYTFFSIYGAEEENIFPNLLEEVIGCLTDNGDIKSIEWADESESAIEFWVCDNENNAEPYYLIDWTGGTIECQR